MLDTDSRTLTSLPAGTPIQFFDLKAQQATIRPALEKRWIDILDHGRFIGGPEVDECERKLCEFTGAADAVAVGSGTQALVMPLIALGYGHGDAVFIPGFTYNATANAVLLAGATPILVDIEPGSFNMDPADLERKIDKVKANRNLRARAVMPVDLYGLAADYPALNAVAEAHGLRMVADAAQAFGGRQGGQWIGTLTEITATSFYPTKTLGGYGDGGAILVRDAEMGELLRSIRWHGTGANRKESVRVGINGRCDSIQCAVVAEKLGIFEDERQRRIAAARIYDHRLKDVVSPQRGRADDENGYGLYTVRVPERDRVRALLQEKGVPTAVYYDTPIHRMPAFDQFAPPGGLPECERAAAEVLSLPMHPYLSADQIHHVCDALIGAMQA